MLSQLIGGHLESTNHVNSGIIAVSNSPYIMMISTPLFGKQESQELILEPASLGIKRFQSCGPLELHSMVYKLAICIEHHQIPGGVIMSQCPGALSAAS